MPLNLPVQQFPILQAGQMNPFHQALQSGLETQMNISKATYSPLSQMANAASKLTYSGLMGPQFLAKLMQNEDFWGSLSDEQQKALTGSVLGSTGVSPSSGKNDIVTTTGTSKKNEEEPSSEPVSQPTQQRKNWFQGLTDWAKSPSQPFTSSESQQTRSNVGSVGRRSYEDVVNDLKLKGIDPNTQVGQGYIAYHTGPQAYAEAQREGAYVDHPDEFYADYYDQYKSAKNIQPPEKTTAEKVGEYKGTKAQKEQLGKDSAKGIEELGNTYESSVKSEIPMKEISRIVTSPEFSSMRDQIPFFQDKQLWWLSKNGTKQQQEMIGEFKNYANQVVASTVTNFGGRILDKEITLAQNMKVSDNDTMGELIGKLKAAELINETNKRGAKIASDYMQKNPIATKAQALEYAYKQINGNDIKEQIKYNLMPIANDADIKATAAANKISENEAKKRLINNGYRLEIKLMGEQ